MTRAEAERVEPDQRRAEEFLTQAGRFFADAERETTALESAVVLFWSACLSAMDAVLAREGWRIGRGDESHRLRIETAAATLGAGYRELFDRLDEWRRARHEVSYAAVTPPAAMVDALRTDASDAIAATRPTSCAHKAEERARPARAACT